MSSQFTAAVVIRTRATRQVDTRLSAAMNVRYPHVDAAARGWVELEFHVEARNLSDACTKAVAMARAVSGSNPLSCRVTAQEEQVDEETLGAIRLGRHASPGQRMVHPQRLA